MVLANGNGDSFLYSSDFCIPTYKTLETSIYSQLRANYEGTKANFIMWVIFLYVRFLMFLTREKGDSSLYSFDFGILPYKTLETKRSCILNYEQFHIDRALCFDM